MELGHLIFTHGLTATLKSELSATLAKSLHFKVARTDDVRLAMTQRSQIDFGDLATRRAYNAVVYRETFARLESFLKSNHTGILDSTSRSRAFRSDIYAFCQAHHLSPIMIRCYCSYSLSRFRIANYRRTAVDLVGSVTEDSLQRSLYEYELPSFEEPCSILEFDSGKLTLRPIRVREIDHVLCTRLCTLDLARLHSVDWIRQDGLDKLRRPGRAKSGTKPAPGVAEVLGRLNAVFAQVATTAEAVQAIAALEQERSLLIQGNLGAIEDHVEHLLKNHHEPAKIKGVLEQLTLGASGSLLANLIQQVALRLPEYYQYLYAVAGQIGK